MASPAGQTKGANGAGAGGSRSAIPVVAGYAVAITEAERARLEAIAATLAADEPALAASDFFAPNVVVGIAEGPALLIGDNREIALATPRAAQLYEYRIAALASDGDILLISGKRNRAFERYREHVLGLGAMDVFTLPARTRDGAEPLARRCLDSSRALNAIAGKARGAGGLTIVPYICSGNIWRLAAAIAERAETPVHVAAPPPRLARRVNDKIWFAHRVAEVLGSSAQPAFRSVYGPAALASHVARLSQKAERVVVKIPDSAGSAGNVSLDAAEARRSSLRQLRSHLRSILTTIGWGGRFPLLVEVWDAPVLANPSVQIWLPRWGGGAPILEGMYEQVVVGPTGTFVGSVPATLPDKWTERFALEAFRIATLFQKLGYFGRCSFDAILAGASYDEAELHWIECNGRWGGVSTPMTLANRLRAERRERSFVVVQESHLDFAPHTIDEAQEMIAGDLFRVPGSREGIVFLSPLGLEEGYGVNLMAIADTVERATELAGGATAKLITPRD